MVECISILKAMTKTAEFFAIQRDGGRCEPYAYAHKLIPSEPEPERRAVMHCTRASRRFPLAAALKPEAWVFYTVSLMSGVRYAI